MQQKPMNAFSGFMTPARKMPRVNAFVSPDLNPSGVQPIFSKAERQSVRKQPAQTGGAGVPASPGFRPPAMHRQDAGIEAAPPRPSGRKPTDFDKTRDREFAKVITDWTLGGQQTAYTNLQQLGQLIEELEDPRNNLTGPVIGNLPFRSVTAAKSKDAEDRVGKIVQQSLKAVLGAQFAEREAQQLIERSYNRRLDEGFNVDRLKATYNELLMRAQMNDKAAAYLGEHGVLDGFDGSLPQLAEMELYGMNTNPIRDVVGAAQKAAQSQGWEQPTGLSDDEEARYQELLEKQRNGTLK